ncbi:hypothetical protein ACH4C6_07540 [Streptomyces sp. NPDC017943]|uniref:hypothetical protein n=1 Tax=Streptomyces sp. NPDC017943 TaxID=3365019 RepID=UPI0037AFE453
MTATPPPPCMTPSQVTGVAAIGGTAALIALVLIALLAIGIYRIITRIATWSDAYRTRRAHAREQARETAAELAICQAIYALPTTRHPAED